MKITFLGAGSTVFARNVIGDCMCCESLRDSEYALYDIGSQRLEQSRVILKTMKKGKIACFAGVQQQKTSIKTPFL